MKSFIKNSIWGAIIGIMVYASYVILWALSGQAPLFDIWGLAPHFIAGGITLTLAYNYLLKRYE